MYKLFTQVLILFQNMGAGGQKKERKKERERRVGKPFFCLPCCDFVFDIKSLNCDSFYPCVLYRNRFMNGILQLLPLGE